jgi:hypothetical protein
MRHVLGALAAELSIKLSCRSVNGQGLARDCHHRSRLAPGRLRGDGGRRRRAQRDPRCPPVAGSRSTPLSKAPPAMAAKSRAVALSAPIVAVRVPASYRMSTANRNAIAPAAIKLKISSNANFRCIRLYTTAV